VTLPAVVSLSPAVMLVEKAYLEAFWKTVSYCFCFECCVWILEPIVKLDIRETVSLTRQLLGPVGNTRAWCAGATKACAYSLRLACS
jgi:hypothetical protein